MNGIGGQCNFLVARRFPTENRYSYRDGYLQPTDRDTSQFSSSTVLPSCLFKGDMHL